MHGDVSDFCFGQLASDFALELADAFFGERHQLGVMRFDFAEQRIANIHIHFDAADGRTEMIDETGEQILMFVDIATGLSGGVFHNRARELDEAKIIHHRNAADIFGVVTIARAEQMRGYVTDLAFGNVDIEFRAAL